MLLHGPNGCVQEEHQPKFGLLNSKPVRKVNMMKPDKRKGSTLGGKEAKELKTRGFTSSQVGREKAGDMGWKANQL